MTIPITRYLLPLACTLLLTACGGSSSDSNPPNPGSSSSSSSSSSSDGSSSSSSSSSSSASATSQLIKLNQVGYLPEGQKLAVVPKVSADTFILIDVETEEEVFTDKLSAAKTWAPSDESVHLADFTAFTEPGEYQVRVEGLEDSPRFKIAADVYQELNNAALKAYYFNRASMALEEQYAGEYARDEGHPDDVVIIHASAAHGSRSAGDEISAPKGWYDAGDFGKYVVNSGISTYTLLAAYEHFPDYYDAQNVNIPESGGALPDILAEALWNLEGMVRMQDEDGGVYHKLTTLTFSGNIMPHEGTAARYVIGKGTSATLNFAAGMAQASRIYPDRAAEMLVAAERAWQWAMDNPAVKFENPSDVQTGEYGGNNLASNRAWAAAELYITTGDEDYYTALNPEQTWNTVPGWPDSRGLAWMSLAHHMDNLTEADEAFLTLIEERIMSLAEDLLAQTKSSAYRVGMGQYDFYWGSNSTVLNRAMMLLQGYRLSGNTELRDAAQSKLDYILGRNPTDFSYVTGYGTKTPMNIHHRASVADGIAEPVPGFVAGGPNPQDQNDCGASQYPSKLPALSYLDKYCSYSTNEVTINWNAPLVYVSGALQAMAMVEDE